MGKSKRSGEESVLEGGIISILRLSVCKVSRSSTSCTSSVRIFRKYDREKVSMGSFHFT